MNEAHAKSTTKTEDLTESASIELTEEDQEQVSGGPTAVEFKYDGHI